MLIFADFRQLSRPFYAACNDSNIPADTGNSSSGRPFSSPTSALPLFKLYLEHGALTCFFICTPKEEAKANADINVFPEKEKSVC